MKVLKKERLLSLDVFRGITIVLMILVNNPGTWKHVYPALKHAKWNGCTLTDLVFPFFLFIVGVAIPFSMEKREPTGDSRSNLILRIIIRSLILFILGLFLNGFPHFELSTWRIPGVLQRIALVYCAAAVLFLRCRIRSLGIIFVSLLFVYWGLMTLVPVPGFGKPGLSPGMNLAAWLDNLIMPGHLWKVTKVWDPEGLMSTLPAVATALMGVFTGQLLLSENDNIFKTAMMCIFGNFSLLVSYFWSIWFPLNKSLWTSSYVLFTGGIALNVLAVCYWLIDMKGYTRWAKPFQVFGMNAIALYFLSGIFGKLIYHIKVLDAGKSVSIQAFLFNNTLSQCSEPLFASFLWAVLYIIVWLGLMYIPYKAKIFIKV